MKSISKSLILGAIAAMLVIVSVGCGNQDANATGQKAVPPPAGQGTHPKNGNASTPENM